MGLFDFLRGPDINEGVRQYHEASGAVLLDVRTPEEFVQGHIPGSRNLPLGDFGNRTELAPDRSAPLFVYCLSGARSGQAVTVLRQMGYQNVTNIGGIGEYRGKVER